jgi:hypothetical protein
MADAKMWGVGNMAAILPNTWQLRVWGGGGVNIAAIFVGLASVRGTGA